MRLHHTQPYGYQANVHVADANIYLNTSMGDSVDNLRMCCVNPVNVHGICYERSPMEANLQEAGMVNSAHILTRVFPYRSVVLKGVWCKRG